MRVKIGHLIPNYLLAVMVIFLATSATFAQKTITGKVTDAETNEPLIAASVFVKGTTTGASTDIDGSYSIVVPDGATTLTFTYTGYADLDIAIAGQSTINASLSPGTALDEVVVVGYGTQTRKEVTSSVATVKAEDFNQGNVSDPIRLVQGKVAGLSISSPSGDPNGSTTVRLRGLASVGANTSPLIVVDGVIGASLDVVDPNDIESIDVLKDGSAAAIYGSRASAGVIIITTKQGKGESASVNYNAFAAIETIARTVQTADAAEFARLRPGTDRGSNTNWIDEVTDNAFSHTHNLSMSGSTGATNYRASFNLRDAEGVAKGTGFNQLNGRINVTQKALNERLTLTANVAATQKNSEFGVVEALRYGTLYNPTAPVLTDESDPLFSQYGGYYQEVNFDYFNPVAIQEQSLNVGELKRLSLQGKAALELTDGLIFTTSYATQRESDFSGSYYNKQAFFRGVNTDGLASRYTEDRTNNLFEATLGYNTDFSGVGLDAVIGYSYNDITRSNFGATAGKFISDDLTFNNIGSALQIPEGAATVFTGKENYKVIGFFGRANFNIDDTYYASVAVRREGSSRLGPNNQWGTFPSVSAGVDVTKLADIGGADQLKVRVAYGLTGSLPPASYLSQLSFSQQGSFFYNGAYVPAFGPARNANPDLKWEQKAEFNAGIDFAFMDYALTGSVEFYNRTTTDLIFFTPVPVPPNLAPNTWANLDDVSLSNTGVELQLSYTYESGDLSITPNFVLGTFNTTLNALDVTNPTYSFFGGGSEFLDNSTSPGAPGLNDNPTVIVQANAPVGQIYGPVYSGVSADGSSFIFEDLNGDGSTDIDNDGLVDAEDKQVIGSGLPTLSLGLGSGIGYGNLDINFYFRGDIGHDLVNMYRVFYEPLGNGSREIENIVQTSYFDENLRANPQFSSHYVEKASFVVLDNMSIGYTLDLPDNSPFENVRLNLTGRNLFYITNYQGVSPEVRYFDPGASDNGGTANGFNVLAPGLERRNTYFTTRQFAFGVNATF